MRNRLKYLHRMMVALVHPLKYRADANEGALKSITVNGLRIGVVAPLPPAVAPQ
jgi:hypothetical protein